MSDAVAVVGAGTMGRQIALEYALGGATVYVLGHDPGRSRDAIAQTVREAAELELWPQADLTQAAGLTRIAAHPSDLPEVSIVVECLPESFETKVAVLGAVLSRQPTATVASNTSSLSITALGTALDAADRTLGTHYWNPPLLAPLVEVVPGEQTEPNVVAEIVDKLISLGKRPLVLEREVPGFVWNRLQAALLREALWLVEQRVASKDVVDEIVRSGLARRYRHIGIFEAVALGGPITWQRVCENLFPVLSDAVAAPQLEAIAPVDDVARDRLRRRRDERLVAELKSGRDW